jgi:hypothetical protein
VEIPVIQNGANCGKSGHRFWVLLQDREAAKRDESETDPEKVGRAFS